MKKRIIFLRLISILILMAFQIAVSAQISATQQKEDFWKRVTLGGYLGVQIGSITGIVVSPEAQVRIVNQLYGGLGLTYQYNWYRDYYYQPKSNQYQSYSCSVYGGRIFARYYLRGLIDNSLGNIFAHVEYEYLRYVRPYTMNPNGNYIDPYGNHYSQGHDVVEINSVFVGGGYAQPLGGRAFLDLLILYNLNETYNSPYSNPVFRMGFGIGL